MGSAKSRDKIIVNTSIKGILANVALAGFKAAVGLLSNSIAIVLDAVNNISDAASSAITIIGTKLAGRAPDKKHPFGHGRTEYLSAMIIAVIVLYAGITSLIESIKKIITPETPDYSYIALIIVAVSVAVKIILGIYVKNVGKKVNSESLMNSGDDAKLDSVISAATLAAAIIFIFAGVSIEAYLAAVISAIIIKSGIDMLRRTISEIVGERADADFAIAIKETVKSFPEVEGAYDLVLNNYGPDKFNGSIHIEVPDTYSADQLDDLLRRITIEVYHKHKVILTAIGVYSRNTKDAEIAAMREKVKELVFSVPHVLEMHGFYVRKAEKVMRFDLLISFDSKDRLATYREAVGKVQEAFPDYTLQAVMDT
ncbi:MAG: cation transporter, partial [Lachnospiraceae bacterium]|nr:cation transporter [Lachnospiraceae bacterium]